MENTYALDASAMIHLASRTRKHTNSFRITITLFETIDPVSLQQAVNRIVPRFPTIIAGIRRGIFQYSVLPVTSPPKVAPDTQPLAPMGNEEIKNCAVRFLYKENAISVEIFHALTDGNGGMTAAITLVAEYLRIRYGAHIVPEGIIADLAVKPEKAELSDDYQRCASANQKPPAYTQTWQISSKEQPDLTVFLASKSFDAGTVRNAARRYGVSVTAFLSGIMLASVLELKERYTASRKAVQIMVLVNLRKLLPSCSLRNFSLYALLRTPSETPNPSLSALIRSCSEQLTEQNQADYMSAAVSSTMLAQNHVLYRILPLSLKSRILRWIHRMIGEQTSCISLSNLGRIDLPEEMQKWISGIDIALTPRIASPYNCGVVTYGNQLTIQFSRSCPEPALETIFFQNLDKEIHLYMTFNKLQTGFKHSANNPVV